MSFFEKLKINRLPSTKFDAITRLPECVFFDYDGTIINNSKYLVKAFNYALKCNFNKKKDKKILNEIKKIKKDSDKWNYIKTNCSNEIFAKCNTDYDIYLSSQRLCKIRGVENVLKKLKKLNIPMYVISQKRGDGLREELKKAKLMPKYFVNAYGTLDFKELQKPSKEYVDAVRTDSKTKSKSCWMIGDRCSDVITGINMNGKAFIIDKGEFNKINQEFNDEIGKKIFFTSYRRLEKLIKKLSKKNSF